MSWFNTLSPPLSIHSNCPPCCSCGLVFFCSLYLIMVFFLVVSCHLCAVLSCNICARSSCLSVCPCLVTVCVCQLLSGIRLIWRGWTGDGLWGVSSAGSRAEVNWDRRCITSLPTSNSLCFCFSHPVFIVLHCSTCLSPIAHISSFLLPHVSEQMHLSWATILHK